MAVSTARHQHRHFKTLILLVLSMTGGTFLLFWIGGLAPVTPLRGERPTAKVWTRMAVRAEDARRSPGFFHFRIDGDGRRFQSNDWKAGREDTRNPGTIEVLVSSDLPQARLTPVQTKALARLIADLRGEFGIPKDRVRVGRRP